MTDAPPPQEENLSFRSEAQQLLKLMTRSLYSNKEVFLRELISNASDAIERLRFESISSPDLLKDSAELSITISYSSSDATLSIADTGIGMSKQEVIDNLGTIAKSGTEHFLKSLSGNEKKDTQLIGQFGVGFYSSFIVADEVIVLTRRAGSSEKEGVRFRSTGKDNFSLSSVDKPECGTTVILKLNAESREFLDRNHLKGIVQKYANHLNISVRLASEDEAKGEASEDQNEPEAINQAQALWLRSKSEIKEEEYNEFYELFSHTSEQPLAVSHNRIEGKIDYTSLLFIPGKAPFDIYNRESPRGLKLYVQRVFIMDNAEQFLPTYLRFVRGVVDCNDLPLNVSRELLQENQTIQTIRNALTKRVLDMLAKMAKNEKDDYLIFWKEFGALLKEGLLYPDANVQPLKNLLRFPTALKKKNEVQSLSDYLASAPVTQKNIYYLLGDNVNQARHSPHLEVLKDKKYDALLCCDPIDTWVMMQLDSFNEKEFQNAAQGDLELEEGAKEAPAPAEEEGEDPKSPFLEKITQILAGKITEARASSRLKDSPVCLVDSGMNEKMRQLIQTTTGQGLPESQPILELKLDHPLIRQMSALDDDDLFEDLAFMLFDQAYLTENAIILDPIDFVRRLNRLLGTLAFAK